MKTALLLCLISVNIFATQTNLNSNVQAKYKISTPAKTSYINYYREGDKVAYEYPAQGITEIWTKLPKNRVALTRVFNNYQRNIEYDTIDLKMEKRNSSWKAHKNFSFIKNLDYDLAQEETVDGQKVWHYVKRGENIEINMYWDNKRDLLISFEVRENTLLRYHYERLSLEEEKVGHIQKVIAYDTTDFSDIGDNESDPFFRKMINLGFLTHNEANIIDAHGNHLELAHSGH